MIKKFFAWFKWKFITQPYLHSLDKFPDLYMDNSWLAGELGHSWMEIMMYYDEYPDRSDLIGYRLTSYDEMVVKYANKGYIQPYREVT